MLQYCTLLSAIDRANNQLIEAVKPEMERAAGIAGVPIKSDLIAYASLSGITIVNSIISGLGDTSPDFEHGVKALFVYTSKLPKYSIPAGFYTLNVFTDKIQFLDNNGNIVAQVPSTLSKDAGQVPSTKEGVVTPMLSGGIRGGDGFICVHVDFTVLGHRVNLEVCVEE